MTTPSNSNEHVAKILELKAKYERDGYEVLVEPQRSALPFDLGNYIPDLIARKNAGGLVIEVKGAKSRISIERYQSIARSIKQHPGWRFLLVTIDDLNVPASTQEMVSWDALEEKLANCRTLIEDGNPEPATLYLWSIFESAMRRLAVTLALPIERLPAVKLMNHLYTAGYISVDQFASAKIFLSMRNGITHGFGTAVDHLQLSSFLGVTSDLVAEWSVEKEDTERQDD